MGRFAKLLAAAAITALTPVAVSASSVLDVVTPDVIFGDGNLNGSFTISKLGGVELGLRAKLRYDLTGQPTSNYGYDGIDTYTFMTADSNAPANRSIFNFEWSISTLAGALDAFTYLLTVDTDPTAANNSAIVYNPFAGRVYLGTSATTNGSATEVLASPIDLASYTVAQNSVNMGFLTAPFAPIPVPLGSGQFTFTLTAFDSNGLVNSTAMNVIVEPAAPSPVPLPAGGLLLIGAIGGLAALRRRAKRA